MASVEGGFLFQHNHQFQLEGAMEAGYRGINLDVCKCNGQYQLGICDHGARDPVETFASINSFLDEVRKNKQTNKQTNKHNILWIWIVFLPSCFLCLVHSIHSLPCLSLSLSHSLDKNPTETILVILEINNDADETVDLNELYSVLSGVQGLLAKLYVHEETATRWPTLRETVDANTVSFHFLDVC
jgi:hypothetical protein